MSKYSQEDDRKRLIREKKRAQDLKEFRSKYFDIYEHSDWITGGNPVTRPVAR